MKKALILTIATILITGPSLFAGDIGGKLSQESIIETIQQKKVIRVGMSTFVPWQ